MGKENELNLQKQEKLPEHLGNSLRLAYKVSGETPKGQLLNKSSLDMAQATILKREGKLSDEEISHATGVQAEVVNQSFELYKKLAEGLNEWLKYDRNSDNEQEEVVLNKEDLVPYVGLAYQLSTPSERLKNVPTHSIAQATILKREGKLSDEEISQELAISNTELINESFGFLQDSTNRLNEWLNTEKNEQELSPDTEVHLQTAGLR